MKSFEKQIVVNETISPFFIKANFYLISNCQEQFEMSIDKTKTLETLWSEKFKATLEKSNGYYNKVIFNSEKDLTLFSLRFD